MKQERLNELLMLGFVIFIAIIAAELWIEQHRALIVKSQLALASVTEKQSPLVIAGFSGGI